MKRIADFLYRSENINHKDVVYMNCSKDTGIFEGKSNGSHIYLEFTDDEEVSKILYSLQGDDGIVHHGSGCFIMISELRLTTRANHSLQRARRVRRNCNRGVPWAGSLSFDHSLRR